MTHSIEPTPELPEPVLLHVLTTHFNLEELKTLSFQVGVPFDEIPGQSLTSKSREFIAFLVRRGQVNLLVDAIIKERPNIDWTILNTEISNEQSEVKPIEHIAQPQLTSTEPVLHEIPTTYDRQEVPPLIAIDKPTTIVFSVASVWTALFFLLSIFLELEPDTPLVVYIVISLFLGLFMGCFTAFGYRVFHRLTWNQKLLRRVMLGMFFLPFLCSLAAGLGGSSSFVDAIGLSYAAVIIGGGIGLALMILTYLVSRLDKNTPSD